MTLRFETYLGSNAVRIMAAMAAELRTRGVEVAFDESTDDAVRLDRICAGAFDVAWVCGLLTNELIAGGLDAQIVAAPVFHGSRLPVYHSVIVAGAHVGATRLGELGGGRVARNELGSWSGWHAFRQHLIERDLSDRTWEPIDSGSHLASLQLVRDGAADLAAVDSTVWSSLGSAVDGVRVIDRTRDWPAPPFSFRMGLDEADVIAQLARTARSARVRSTGLTDVVAIDPEAYGPLRRLG